MFTTETRRHGEKQNKKARPEPTEAAEDAERHGLNQLLAP